MSEEWRDVRGYGGLYQVNRLAMATGYVVILLCVAAVVWGWCTWLLYLRHRRRDDRSLAEQYPGGDNEARRRQRRARVGRPTAVVVLVCTDAYGNQRVFDFAWRQDFETWAELAADLTTEGAAILEMERRS